MTERHPAYVVLLDHALSAEDSRQVAEAICMVRGVSGVVHVTEVPSVTGAAAMKRDQQWQERIQDLLTAMRQAPL